MISLEPRNLGRVTYLNMDYEPVKASDVFSRVLYRRFPKTKKRKTEDGSMTDVPSEDEILYADFITDNEEVFRELKEIEGDVQKHMEMHKTTILPRRVTTPPIFSTSITESDNRASIRVILPTNKNALGCQDETGNVTDFEKIREELENAASDYTADLAIVPENMWISMGKFGVKFVTRGIKLRKVTPELQEIREKQSGPKRGPVFL